MKKWIIAAVIMICVHDLHAQYLHYWDDSRPRRQMRPAPKPEPPAEKPVVVASPKEEVPPPPPVIAKPVSVQVPVLIAGVTVAANFVVIPILPMREPLVFHDWPDKCPGLSGAMPVLINYVPAEIVLIVTEKFKGHLYSISTNTGPDNRPQYKLKVCEDGMIQYKYANYKGDIISENEE